MDLQMLLADHPLRLIVAFHFRRRLNADGLKRPELSPTLHVDRILRLPAGRRIVIRQRISHCDPFSKVFDHSLGQLAGRWHVDA